MEEIQPGSLDLYFKQDSTEANKQSSSKLEGSGAPKNRPNTASENEDALEPLRPQLQPLVNGNLKQIQSQKKLINLELDKQLLFQHQKAPLPTKGQQFSRK